MNVLTIKHNDVVISKKTKRSDVRFVMICRNNDGSGEFQIRGAHQTLQGAQKDAEFMRNSWNLEAHVYQV